jgi:predicted enzyme related to lactoylglutathione lyase
MVQKMAFVAYSVRDLEAAKTFYRDTIGLTPSDMFGEHWAEFDVDGVTFGIGNGEPLGITPGTSFSATFEVDDITAERRRLVDLGVPVTEVHETPICFVAFVTDPEGNKFGIHQRKS